MYVARNGAFRAAKNVVVDNTPVSGPSADHAEDQVIKQWLRRRRHDVITDYNPHEDEIVLVYDAKHHPNPLVTLDFSQAPLWAKVLIDGVEIAKVNLPLALADIRLLPV